MSDDAAQAERIKQLVELACIARGWSRQALAAHLGRDVSRLVPEAGNPKLDYVMKLADALEWPVGDVARAIWDHPELSQAHAVSKPSQARDFISAKSLWRSAFDAGHYRDAVSHAREMGRFATTADERGWAIGNESAAVQGLGQYHSAIEIASRGLREAGLDLNRRLHLQANIANCLLNLWDLPLAMGLSRLVIDQCELLIHDPRAMRWRSSSLFILATSHLRSARIEADQASRHLSIATEIYPLAIQGIDRVSVELSDPAFSGLSELCRVGLVDADVLAKRSDAATAIDKANAKLDECISRTDAPANYELEAYAWWALLGCSLALEHLQGRAMQRAMAVFTQHVYMIGERLRNGGMFGAVLSLEIAARRSLGDGKAEACTFALDPDDRRALYEASLSSESNRRLAWKVLECSAMDVGA